MPANCNACTCSAATANGPLKLARLGRVPLDLAIAARCCTARAGALLVPWDAEPRQLQWVPRKSGSPRQSLCGSSTFIEEWLHASRDSQAWRNDSRRWRVLDGMREMLQCCAVPVAATMLRVKSTRCLAARAAVSRCHAVSLSRCHPWSDLCQGPPSHQNEIITERAPTGRTRE
ncbi:hypothetical protein BN1708_008353 [Verticillium longisporum]|uniref:Uncharacterized protein n=1 Tax=Verticillium longisporum TaxID=100787 RepID=A0A0G4N3J8_VERLO|nr:hypothetical protein BN1708_008353 [Verticillium longisporum]